MKQVLPSHTAIMGFDICFWVDSQTVENGFGILLVVLSLGMFLIIRVLY